MVDLGRGWPAGWEAHRKEQLRRWARATPARRLAWVEEAIEMIRKLGTPLSRSRVVEDRETDPT